ncbi:dihydroorotate dehydrogenase electron transfer subunit [Clostridium sp. DJ247]|uniref:dihydroorotate dehydrogenase electron transfer subunit n=1 Tax=Clostridium sp. DJ247 TaxID=2726188 RepID=UPI00162410D3|nr:dihydroorotate dehydrogenase electron transfer subunit [Clostridium sp. DJ247]MBC2579829.1 dihydroorotate dehydrogenase electron transfer subunit [Clostridium sp. DJ247]
MEKLNVRYSSVEVYKNMEISQGIFELTIKGSFQGRPGQFYMVRSWDKEPILSRPISIYHIDEESLVFLYQVVGQGTIALSQLKSGDKMQVMGPFGNGFDLDKIKGNVAIVSGGIGVAPMYYVAEKLSNCKIDVYAGFRDMPYALDGFKAYVNTVNVATENGVVGHKGYITEIFNPKDYDVVLCCGPEVMMEKVVKICESSGVPVYVSLEKHMACGVGACLVCTCKTKSGNKRTCKDGPVFLGSELL